MKIQCKKEVKFLGNQVKISGKGNKYNTVNCLSDGQPIPFYANGNLDFNNLEFGQNLSLDLEITYATKYDKAEIVNYKVI